MYADFPTKLQGGKLAFVDSVTKIAKTKSSQVSCGNFTAEVQTEGGNWFTFSPELKEMDPPTKLNLKRSSQSHEDLSGGDIGLYSSAEVRSWEESLSQTSFSNAVLSSITYGACIHKRACQSASIDQGGQPPFDMELPRARQMLLSLMDRLQDLLKQYLAQLCWIILSLELFKLIMFMFNTIISCYYEGMTSCTQVMIGDFCPAYRNWRCLQRRTARCLVAELDLSQEMQLRSSNPLYQEDSSWKKVPGDPVPATLVEDM